VLDTDRAAALDAELKWFGAALGQIRDRQVLRAHLDGVLAELPAELVLGPVAARIHTTLADEQRQARAELERVMRSRRYYALLRELRAWRAQPPITGADPAGDVKRYLRGAERKVRRRLKAATRAAERDAAMHRARKAAKRARYTAELSEPALGSDARASTERAKNIQQRLGERQDHVVAADFLRRVGAVAGTTPGENGFTFGLLYEREIAAAQHIEG
jgi:CHAD domain-containing protein